VCDDEGVDRSTRFYADLPAFERFTDVSDLAHYRPAPDDWHVVITDVRGSTKAIEAGRYKDVNALGVASIVALRNAIADVEIPYVFGGDGATALVPAETLDAVRAALRGTQRMSAEAFELELRCGIVPVSTLREAGAEVLVARFAASEHVCLAMFSGNGLTEAERRIKDTDEGPRWAVEPEGDSTASFDGFECRWLPIPSTHGTIVSLLVQATDADSVRATSTYRAVLDDIEAVLGEHDGRPVRTTTLKLMPFAHGFGVEAKIHAGRPRGAAHWRRAWKARAEITIGKLLFALKGRAGGMDGGVYRDEVTANTDFRKFDDTLRMVLDLDAQQLAYLEAKLSARHADGTIVYGVHTAPASLMTCAIGTYSGDHVHFVDGADGGYALAAKQMKSQLAARRRGVGDGGDDESERSTS
jgi:hypothetical protein